MNKDLTLLIMAAGMGSRFGGLKQIEPVGPNGEFIIDYSIYDAIKAGFNKVVFIIKKENYEVFKETIGLRVEPHIKVEYVFQEMDTIPEFVERPSDRIKPWGTAHAILAAKDVINEPFAIVNADDFYGYDAYKTIADFLKNVKTTNLMDFAMVAYQVSNTITENGSVKRGVCDIKENYLTKLIESKVERVNGVIVASPLDGSSAFNILDNSPVSMNIFGFTPNMFDYISEKMPEFFLKHKNDLDKCEFLIPDLVFKGINEGICKVHALHTSAVWYGVTYKEDKDGVVRAIKEMVDNNIYPENLWK